MLGIDRRSATAAYADRHVDGAHMEIEMEPLLTTVNDAAQALSLGRTTIYVLINAGELETVKIGRRTLVTIASIRRMAEAEK